MTVRLAALLVLMVLARAAHADSGRAFGLDELIDLSEEVVVGEVVGSNGRWQGKLVVTDTTVRVDEPLKGSPPRELTITQLGGTVVHPTLGVEITTQASTFTTLRPGEAVVLFLDQRAGMRQLVGAQQGKLTVRSEPGAGAPAVAVGPKRLRVAPEPRAGAVDGGGAVDVRGMTLDELRARVRARVEGGTK